jgi:hypothetical protein
MWHRQICASAPVLRPLLTKLHMSFSSQGMRKSTRDTSRFHSLPDDARTVSTDRRSMVWYKNEATSWPLSGAEKGHQGSYELGGRGGVDVEAGAQGDLGQHIVEPAAAAGRWLQR